MTSLIVLLVLAAWLACGFIAVYWRLRTVEKAFHVFSWSEKPDGASMSGFTALGPLALLVQCTHHLHAILIRAAANKTRIADELRKEAQAAEKEIESILGGRTK